MTDLEKQLLDLSNSKVEFEDLEKKFDDIARGLLRQTKIIANKEQYLIKEVEFYYYNTAINHIDNFSHNHNRQLEFGEWYFHRFTNAISFLNSKRNGLDITFGNTDSKVFGGILIRNIEHVLSKKNINGINNVVRELIQNISNDELEYLALKNGKQVFDTSKDLHLVNSGNNNFSEPIYKVRRNNLGKFSNETDYHNKSYCYFNHNLYPTQIIEI